MIIKLLPSVGKFAENKDLAKEIRVKKVMPALARNEDVTFDFVDVEGATQSFIHALVSDPIRKYQSQAFDKLFYKNTNEDIQEIISTVYRYMQESLDGIGERE